MFPAQLPFEIIDNIFSWLDVHDLCRAAQVSWAWNLFSSLDSMYVFSSRNTNRVVPTNTHTLSLSGAVVAGSAFCYNTVQWTALHKAALSR
jgi:hypothetical protein